MTGGPSAARLGTGRRPPQGDCRRGSEPVRVGAREFAPPGPWDPASEGFVHPSAARGKGSRDLHHVARPERARRCAPAASRASVRRRPALGLAAGAQARGPRSGSPPGPGPREAGAPKDKPVAPEEARMNPLLAEWQTPFAIPPFAEIEDAHVLPAFEEALARARGEIAAVAGSGEPPSFANTIEALERADRDLDRVLGVFFNLASADANPEREALMRELSPRLAAYGNEIVMNRDLWARVETLWEGRDDLDLTPEQARVLMLTRRSFVRAGAALEGRRPRAAGRDQGAAGGARHALRAEPPGRRARLVDAFARGRARGPARLRARRRRGRGPRAGRGRPRGDALAQPRRAVPPVLPRPEPCASAPGAPGPRAA